MRSLLRRRRWLYAALFSTWIPLLFLVSQGRQNSAGFGYGLSAWEYLLHQFGAITHYLRLSVWPDELVLDYGVAATRNVSEILPSAILVGDRRGQMACVTASAAQSRLFRASCTKRSQLEPAECSAGTLEQFLNPAADVVRHENNPALVGLR